MSLTVAPHEHSVIRVFSLSMTPDEARALRDNEAPGEDSPSPQQTALGATYLDADFTEIFPVSDLEELGLAGYLETGNGIDPAQLSPDRAKLDALDGWVFLVYSSAFGGFAQTLKPIPALTLIGTYSEPGTDWTENQPLESRAATEPAPARKGPSDAAMSGRIAMAALLVIFALTALMVWIAG